MNDRDQIDAAFRATTYRVFAGEGPIDIRIGDRSPALDALLDDKGCAEWAFITAWNPGARAASANENALHHSELLQALRDRGFEWLDGSGIPARDDWDAEASVLVLGIATTDAVALAKRFGQVAIVAGQRAGPAELVYCD